MFVQNASGLNSDVWNELTLEIKQKRKWGDLRAAECPGIPDALVFGAANLTEIARGCGDPFAPPKDCSFRLVDSRPQDGSPWV